MKGGNQKVFIPGAASLLLALLLYLFLFRDLVISAYEGNAPAWLNNLILFLYPRFEIEKHRFPLEFFLSKADQIILRLFLIGALTAAGSYLINTKEKVKERFSSFWNRTTSIQNTSILRILYFSFLIIIFHDIYFDLMRLESASVFYKPITPYRLLNIPFPSETSILVICILFFLSCLLAIINFYPVLNSVIAVAIFIAIQGFIFSFEKYDHGFATFTYAGLIFPFLLHERKLAVRKGLSVQQAWPLTLIIVCICLSYFFTGMEKILISHIHWLNGSSLRSHLLIHDIPLGKTLAEYPALVILLANLTLIIQVGFIFVLFKEKLKYFLIPAGFLFHYSVSIFLGVGGILNPWILVYIFFFDWSWVKRKIFKLREAQK